MSASAAVIYAADIMLGNGSVIRFRTKPIPIPAGELIQSSDWDSCFIYDPDRAALRLRLTRSHQQKYHRHRKGIRR